ncbi:MAG: 30S ribosomal protein S19e [Theionarchaea archaeon]|nr:MAG: 30S ribosomal protein S19 [Theionarchaea archaeon DG-70]MBU7012522.1 30S ribosomal protein S19e [Theionarchaea archaeon]
MTTVYDVPPHDLLTRLTEDLKEVEEIIPPVWSQFVKTGVCKERPPVQKDWWYIRAASLLRRLYVDGPVGVERLRRYYGGKKNRGHKPEKFQKASGAIIRNILQQLEKAGYVEKCPQGRRLTGKGASHLDRLAYEVKLAKGMEALEQY